MVATGLDIASAITSIIQLIEYTLKVYRRVDEFQSNARDIPKTFRQFSHELPLLQNTLRQVGEAIKNGQISDEIQRALTQALKGCSEQVESLNTILGKILPGPYDSRGEKARQAIASLTKDSKIEKKMNAIRSYLSTLTFYFVASSSSLRPLVGTISYLR
jgi:chromosome segregation ATPase